MSAMTHGILTFTHTIIQKQLVLKISGIQPKIPLIQSNMYGQGSRIQGMMKAHLPRILLCSTNTSATTATNSQHRSQETFMEVVPHPA